MLQVARCSVRGATFTFQSGSIQICRTNINKCFHFFFTFQSGSIQINFIIKIVGIIKVLYIPIWFYSNDPMRVNDDTTGKLYIPIWFYSNTITFFAI